MTTVSRLTTTPGMATFVSSRWVCFSRAAQPSHFQLDKALRADVTELGGIESHKPTSVGIRR